MNDETEKFKIGDWVEPYAEHEPALVERWKEHFGGSLHKIVGFAKKSHLCYLVESFEDGKVREWSHHNLKLYMEARTYA